MKKKLLTLMLAFMVAVSMGMLTPENASAAAKAKKPAKVAKLKATPGKKSVKLKWKKSKRAKGYIVYMAKGNSKKYKKVATTKKTKRTIKGLTSGTKYKFYVRGYKLQKTKKYLNPETGKWQNDFIEGAQVKTVKKRILGKKSKTVKVKTKGRAPNGGNSSGGSDADDSSTDSVPITKEERARSVMDKVEKYDIVLADLYDMINGNIYPVDMLDEGKEQGWSCYGLKWFPRANKKGYDGCALFRNGDCLGHFSFSEDTYVDIVYPFEGHTWGEYTYQIKYWKKSGGKYVYGEASNKVTKTAGVKPNGKDATEIYIDAKKILYTKEFAAKITNLSLKPWMLPTMDVLEKEWSKLYFSGNGLIVARKAEFKPVNSEINKLIDEFNAAEEARMEEEKRIEDEEKQEEALLEEETYPIQQKIYYARSAAQVAEARAMYDSASDKVKQALAGKTVTQADIDKGSKYPLGAVRSSAYEELKIKEFAVLYTKAKASGNAEDINAALEKWNSISDNFYGMDTTKMMADVDQDALGCAWMIGGCRKEQMKPLHDNLLQMMQ